MSRVRPAAVLAAVVLVASCSEGTGDEMCLGLVVMAVGG
jgi:hypothetical protein